MAEDLARGIAGEHLGGGEDQERAEQDQPGTHHDAAGDEREQRMAVPIVASRAGAAGPVRLHGARSRLSGCACQYGLVFRQSSTDLNP